METTLDLTEYAEGQDGFGLDIETALKQVKYPGSLQDFYTDVLGEITDALEERGPENEDKRTKVVVDIPDSPFKVTAVAFALYEEDGSVFRIKNIKKCIARCSDDFYDITAPIWDMYVRDWVENELPDGTRRFPTRKQTTMLQIAKKLKHK